MTKIYKIEYWKWPIAGRIGDNDVMIFVDSDDSPGLPEAHEHPVGPASVAVLQMLQDLQIEVNVHLEFSKHLKNCNFVRKFTSF